MIQVYASVMVINKLLNGSLEQLVPEHLTNGITINISRQQDINEATWGHLHDSHGWHFDFKTANFSKKKLCRCWWPWTVQHVNTWTTRRAAGGSDGWIYTRSREHLEQGEWRHFLTVTVTLLFCKETLYRLYLLLFYCLLEITDVSLSAVKAKKIKLLCDFYLVNMFCILQNNKYTSYQMHTIHLFIWNG